MEKVKQRRIGFLISSTGWGGLEMNVLKLANSLSKEGYRLVLFTTPTATLPRKQEGVFAEVHFFEKNRKYFDWKCAKGLARLLKQCCIDQLLLFDNKDLDVVAWTKTLYRPGLRLIYQQQMQLGVRKRDWIHTWRYRNIDRWICPLPWLKQELKEKTRFPLERVRIIPLGVVVDQLLANRKEQEGARAAFGLPKTAVPLLGIIGRIAANKGQRLVVNSVKKLRDRGHDVQLLVVGSPTVNDPRTEVYYEEMQQFVQTHQLQEVVHFLPHQGKVIDFFSAIDCFVLASESETYGMVTVEAMLAGVPVIGTRQGGTSELLQQGQRGRLYDFGDEEALCEQIIDWLDHRKESIEVANQARDEALEKYDHQQELRDIVQLLEGLNM